MTCKWAGIAFLGFVAVSYMTGIGLGQQTGDGGTGTQNPAGENLPKDVYRDSRFRLPLVNRAGLDDYGKSVYDKLGNPNRKSLAGLQGPTGIRLYSPVLADAMGTANEYLRSDTGFGDPLTELTILVAARELDNQFEWTAHEIAGRKAGLPQQTIDIIKYRKSPQGLGEKETVVIRFGRELFEKKKVSSQTFAAALHLFGRRGVVDLASLMAHYAATSVLLDAFDMQLPPGQQPLLPFQ